MMKKLGLILVFLAGLVFMSGLASADVLINEVMVHPTTGNGGLGEWVELYNNGSYEDLTGWEVGDSISSDTLTTCGGKGLYIDSGEYVLVIPNGATAPISAQHFLCLSSSGTIGNALADAGDTIILNDGTTDVDTHTWSSDPGEEMSLVRNPDGDAWQSNSVTPTPGYSNNNGLTVDLTSHSVFDRIDNTEIALSLVADATDDIAVTEVAFEIMDVNFENQTSLGTETVPTSGTTADGTWTYEWDVNASALTAGYYYLYVSATDGQNYAMDSPILVEVYEGTAPPTNDWDLAVTQPTETNADIKEENSDSVVLTATLTNNGLNQMNFNQASITEVALLWEEYTGTSFSIEVGDITYKFYEGTVEYSELELDSGEIGTVEFTVAIPDRNEMDYFGVYSGVFTIKPMENPIQTTESETINLAVKLLPEHDSGLKIESVDEPDNDLLPGEDFEVDVKIKNKFSGNDKDIDSIEVTIAVPELDIEVDMDYSDLESGDHEEQTLELTIPIDADEGTYTLYVYAAGTDVNDHEQEIFNVAETITVDKESHDLIVSEIKIVQSDVEAGDAITIKVEVENIGKNREEDLVVTLKNAELDINERIVDDDNLAIGDDSKYTFNVEIPANAVDDTYLITASVDYSDVDDQDSTEHLSKTLTLVLGDGGDGTPSSGTVSQPTDVISGTTTGSTNPGSTAKYLLTLTNTEDYSVTYDLSASGIADWATVEFEPGAQITIGPSESVPVYIYLATNEDVSGEQTATIAVRSGTTLVDSATLKTQVGTTSTGGTFTFGRGITSGVSGLGTDTVAIGAVAAVIVIAVAIAGFSIWGGGSGFRLVRTPRRAPRRRR